MTEWASGGHFNANTSKPEMHNSALAAPVHVLSPEFTLQVLGAHRDSESLVLIFRFVN
jgi:hypothetical protein